MNWRERTMLLTWPAFHWRPSVTRRSTESGTLRVVDAAGSAHVAHELPMPPRACPVSRNPIRGTVRIEYTATVAVEVVTLHAALHWACSGAPTAPRSVESLARWLAVDVATSVKSPTSVTVDVLVHPGPQRLVVTHRVP